MWCNSTELSFLPHLPHSKHPDIADPTDTKCCFFNLNTAPLLSREDKNRLVLVISALLRRLEACISELMCLIRYSSDSAVSCGSAVLLPVCISVLRITLWLRCLLFITVAVICQKWYRSGFQRKAFLHLFTWKYFHRQAQGFLDWMLFSWKVIACKSQCIPALDRNFCPAFQKCHSGVFRHVTRMPCPLTLLSDRESSIASVVDLWMLTCQELDEIFFFFFFVRWNGFQ